MLSYLSKRQTSTTKGFINHWSCNGLSYLSKRQTSTTYLTAESDGTYEVVIPIQTIDFYNLKEQGVLMRSLSCHTYPNDRLLQRTSSASLYTQKKLSYLSKRQTSTTKKHHTPTLTEKLSYLSKRQTSTTAEVIVDSTASVLSYLSKRQASTTTKPRNYNEENLVVIPIQTIDFYNIHGSRFINRNDCCHTYPNDRLLQPAETVNGVTIVRCHTYPNDRLLQLSMSSLRVVTKSLSYLSKRQTSTT